MTYRIELEDDVVGQVVRFPRADKAAWDLCLAEIESDPWPRAGDGFEIEELTAGDFFTDYVFTARWFPAAILYLARDFGPDDATVRAHRGEVRIYRLVR
ncbi:MAG TPA: hypothetical protein VFH62_00260 [Dehalococcoidia bacterium]|nr:hypothetical protein [Dehalococcoidia bacterium]